MGRLDGKVIAISGMARGQGRAHAETLAREGADIVGFDISSGLKYPLTPIATPEQLRETVSLVEDQDRRCLAVDCDARDLPGLTAFAATAMHEFGRLDGLIVNHGIWSMAPNSWELEEESWQETIDVMLTGAWKVCKAFVPHIIAGDRGGAVVLTGSVNSVQPQPSGIAYTASKHGIAGIMKVLATELGEFNIRVNTVNPGGIATPMLLEGGSIEMATKYRPEWISHNRALLPVEWIPPESVANAVLWLMSEEARYVTGAMIPVDSGWVAA
jgi:SDR family mycofactocin-dependent oxidoreductase